MSHNARYVKSNITRRAGCQLYNMFIIRILNNLFILSVNNLCLTFRVSITVTIFHFPDIQKIQKKTFCYNVLLSTF